jgi:hypothetical protein
VPVPYCHCVPDRTAAAGAGFAAAGRGLRAGLGATQQGFVHEGIAAAGGVEQQVAQRDRSARAQHGLAGLIEPFQHGQIGQIGQDRADRRIEV